MCARERVTTWVPTLTLGLSRLHNTPKNRGWSIRRWYLTDHPLGKVGLSAHTSVWFRPASPGHLDITVTRMTHSVLLSEKERNIPGSTWKTSPFCVDFVYHKLRSKWKNYEWLLQVLTRHACDSGCIEETFRVWTPLPRCKENRFTSPTRL